LSLSRLNAKKSKTENGQLGSLTSNPLVTVPILVNIGLLVLLVIKLIQHD